MDTEALAYGLAGRRIAALRPPTGADELAIGGTSYADAAAFVGALLVEGPNRVVGPDVAALAVCDLDRIVAMAFGALIGPVAEIHCRCSACSTPFELAIAIDGLVRNPEAGDAVALDPLRFRLPGGTVIRLPVVGDLADRDAATDGPRPFVCEPGDDAPEAIEAALARLCPTTSELVETECPSCGVAMTVDFDLAVFLMKSLLRERDLLLREVHVIARAYGWSLAEILSLPRDIRHGFVRLAGGKPALAGRAAA